MKYSVSLKEYIGFSHPITIVMKSFPKKFFYLKKKFFYLKKKIFNKTLKSKLKSRGEVEIG